MPVLPLFSSVADEAQGGLLSRAATRGEAQAEGAFPHREGLSLKHCVEAAGTEVNSGVLWPCRLDLQGGKRPFRPLS